MDNASKEEISTKIKQVCDAFTTHYTKQYVVELVKTVKKDDAPPPWLLEERSVSLIIKNVKCFVIYHIRKEWTYDIKSGWLVKEGIVNKSWKKRWIVIKANYLVEYYGEEIVVLFYFFSQ